MKVYWAGHFKDGTSDKLWGILKVGLGVEFKYYNFWCRRGARIQFKAIDYPKYSHKAKKYQPISDKQLLTLYPNFFEEAESNLVFNLMAGKVR